MQKRSRRRSEASCKHRGGGQGRGGGRGGAGRGGGRRGAEGGKGKSPPPPPLLDPPPSPPPVHLPVIFRVDANDLPTSDQTETIKGEKRERERERDRRPINTFGGNSKSLQGKQRDSTLGSGQNSTPAERSVK